jgi:hypothetical protein
MSLQVSDERKHLQEADRHIAERRGLIGTQKRRIEDLQRDGHNAVGSIVRELEASLRSMIEDRETIVRKLKRRERHYGA